MCRTLFSALLVIATAAPALAVTNFTATLTSDQEDPDTGFPGSGTATLQLNDAQDILSIDIQLTGVDLDGTQTTDTNDDASAFHIHAAPAGSNGGVVFGFIGPNNDTNGDLVIDAVAGTVTSAWDAGEGNNTTLTAQISTLLNDGLYLNLHTPQFGGGAIRGQILLVPEPTTGALALVIGLFGIVRRRRSQVGGVS